MYVLGHFVEHTRIYHTSPTYAFNLLGGLDEFTCRHQFSLVLPVHHLLVKLGGFLP